MPELQITALTTASASFFHVLLHSCLPGEVPPSDLMECLPFSHSLQVKDFKSHIRRVAAPYLNITHPRQYDSLPRVYVHEHHIPEEELPGIYSAADALVLPTHGEGWGRPQIEVCGESGLQLVACNAWLGKGH